MMGDDIDAKMMRAFIAPTQEETSVVSLDEQKRYILKFAPLLGSEHKTIIAKMLVDGGARQFIGECNEGIIINLDKVQPDLIANVYTFVNFKVAGL